MLNVKKRVLLLVLALVLVIGGTALAATPENVIFLIGDGMGVDHMTVARYLKGSELHMDRLTYNGLATTHSADSYVTDSAAAGTALATGYKTNNGMVSVTPSGKKIKTLLEAAREEGYKTGLVTTTRITHATPACFASHVDDRGKENKIALQILNNRPEVILGGGLRHFLPEDEGGRRKDDLNLLDRAAELGYEVVENRLELISSDADSLFGLFTSSHMSYELDRPQDEPSIAEMTEIALKTLSKSGDGFFLMVEGGRIDHAAHGGDIAGMVYDLLAFDEAVGKALEFAKNNPDTLVVVTADHETGGLGLSNGEYKINTEKIKDMKRTAGFIAGKLNEDRSNARDLLKKYASIEITDEELTKIKEAEGYYGPSNEIGAIMSDRAMVGWTTGSHSAANVMVMAEGPGAELFNGFMDNTDIAILIARAAHYKMSDYIDLTVE